MRRSPKGRRAPGKPSGGGRALPRSWWASASAALLVAGCGVLPQPPSPHEGLDRNSYGPRAIRRYPTGEFYNPTCEPQMKMAADMTTALLGPLSRRSNIDRTILSEKLEGEFSMPGDPGGSPVAILDRNADGIVFWHIAETVPIKETLGAAETYCRREGRSAQYLGTARRCETIRLPIAINGKQTALQTRAISEFRCR